MGGYGSLSKGLKIYRYQKEARQSSWINIFLKLTVFDLHLWMIIAFSDVLKPIKEEFS